MQYLITQQTSIITFDDINLISFIKRAESSEDKGEQFTVFKKISNLSALTNANNFYNIASVIASVEVACSLPDGANTGDAVGKDLDRIFGLMYKKNNDTANNFYVELIISDGIVNASAILNERVKSYENINPESVSVFQIGTVIKSDKNEEIIADKKYTITINEQKMSNLIIKKGLDSFKEFNRKVYVCELSTGVVNG